MKHYHITGVFGEAENGKTTYMVKDVIKKLNEGTYAHAYSNIHIRHPKVSFIHYDELLKLKAPTEKGLATHLVALDQIHRYVDARRSNSQANVDFSNWLIETRQHGVDLIYTTWMRSVVDKRLRPFTNLYVLAQRGENGFEYDLIDKEAGELGPPRLMPWSMAREVWKQFDSTELIEDDTIPVR